MARFFTIQMPILNSSTATTVVVGNEGLVGNLASLSWLAQII